MLDKTLFDLLKKNIAVEDTAAPERDQPISNGNGSLPPSIANGDEAGIDSDFCQIITFGDHTYRQANIDMNG